jgi:proline iminopeptidase
MRKIPHDKKKQIPLPVFPLGTPVIAAFTRSLPSGAKPTRSIAVLILVLVTQGCLDPSEPGNLVPPTVADDPTIPALEFNGSRFHAETFGDPENPPIVFLHGGPNSNYQYLLKFMNDFDGYRLQDHHYLIFWDQRGTGLSKRHNRSELSLDIYLQDLEALIEKTVGDRDFILIGHSWGGQFAAMYMNRHPDRIMGCVLLESGPFSNDMITGSDLYSTPITEEWINDFTWIRQLVGAGDHERADYFLSVLFETEEGELQPQRHEEEKKSRAEEPDNWPSQSREAAAVLLELTLGEIHEESYDFTENLSRVEPEVLLIVGELTEDLGLELARKLARLFQRARVEIVPDSGHENITGDTLDISMSFIRPYLESLSLEGGEQ